MKNTKRVIIYGYTRINLGDDLLIQTLSHRYPRTTFILYAPSIYKKIFTPCTNIKIYSSSNYFAKFINFIGRFLGKCNLYESMLARTCDACVCITGSLFIQKDKNWKSYYNYFQERKINKLPFFLIGANFGPYTDDEFLNSFQRLFSTYDDICFRENYSKNIFTKLSNVRVAPDAVFTNKYILSIGKKIKSTSKSILISLIDLSSRPALAKFERDYLSAIEYACKYFSAIGYKIKLVSFCGIEGDEIACNKILKNLGDCNSSVEFYRGDIYKTIDILASAEIIIASRFHAMIVGWLLGKKVLPICYSKKTVHVLEDIQYNDPYIEINEMKSEDCIYLMHKNSRYNFDFTQTISEAEKQFEKLDRFIFN